MRVSTLMTSGLSTIGCWMQIREGGQPTSPGKFGGNSTRGEEGRDKRDG